MPAIKKELAAVTSVIEQGGFQFTVTEGDIIRVPLVETEEGKEITLDRVLLWQNGGEIKVGTPEVEGAKVSAKVLEHGKYKKIMVVKKKRRKDYKRRNGHRQDYTQLQITSISA